MKNHRAQSTVGQWKIAISIHCALGLDLCIADELETAFQNERHCKRPCPLAGAFLCHLCWAQSCSSGSSTLLVFPEFRHILHLQSTRSCPVVGDYRKLTINCYPRGQCNGQIYPNYPECTQIYPNKTSKLVIKFIQSAQIDPLAHVITCKQHWLQGCRAVHSGRDGQGFAHPSCQWACVLRQCGAYQGVHGAT